MAPNTRNAARPPTTATDRWTSAPNFVPSSAAEIWKRERGTRDDAKGSTRPATRRRARAGVWGSGQRRARSAVDVRRAAYRGRQLGPVGNISPLERLQCSRARSFRSAWWVSVTGQDRTVSIAVQVSIKPTFVPTLNSILSPSVVDVRTRRTDQGSLSSGTD